MPHPLRQLDVFYGDLTPSRAYVYARLPLPSEPGEWKLAGTVRGPRCLHAQTLPTLARFEDLGAGPTLLARAMLTEPIFWTPGLPAIYDVSLKLERGTEPIATEQRELALRALGVREGKLWLDGRPYVPRGVATSSTTARLPREWHEALAMYVCDEASLEPLAEAGQWGALALVELSAGADLEARLRELARFPAVAIAALAGNPPLDFNKKAICPNILVAQVVPAEQRLTTAAWADLSLVDCSEMAALAPLRERTDKPILLRRRLPSPLALPEARAACDALQRDAAQAGQFAGYLV